MCIRDRFLALLERLLVEFLALSSSAPLVYWFCLLYTSTAHALLPLVLERGYADCPDMTRLTKKLAKLYGADLTVDALSLIHI